ncbi:MAG: DUF3822 family protein [Flavobacteriaceae bacterium]
MQEHKNKTSKNSTVLSIHVHVGGLSFFTYNNKNQKATPVVRKKFANHTPIEKLHEEVFSVLKAQQLLEKSFTEVRCSVENNLATLVPKSLFEENSLHEYVQKDIAIEANDFVTYDILPNADWVCVYVPFVNVNNMLIDAFGAFKYYHAVSVWLQALTSHSKADGELVWSLYKENNHLHVALLINKKLQFYNCFEAANPKDVAYYMLLSAKENNVSPNEVPLFVTGDIVAEDAIYKELHTFVRSLNFLLPEHNFLFETPRLHAHQDFCVLNLL